MLFCPSFTQSERFLQTDQLIIRLQVVVVTNFIRMLMRNVFVNVFKSDAVIWWAAIFCSVGPKGGPEGGEGRRVGGLKAGGPKFRAFSLLPPQFLFFRLCLGGLLVESRARFKDMVHPKCAFGSLRSFCAAARIGG